MQQFAWPSLVGTSHIFTSSTTNADDSFNIAVMGAPMVGKSVLINKFVNGTAPTCYWPTVQERYTKCMDIEGRRAVLDIFDTPGGYCFSYLRDVAIANADAFVLVYSVKDEASFETLTVLRDRILHEKLPDVPITVVGNKTDVPISSRFMSKNRAQSIITTVWQNEYKEISAKDDSNISDIFTTIGSMACTFISNQKRLRAQARRRCSRKHKLLKNICTIS
ncbi:ras-related protein Rap-1-like [Haliotis asinina]|uniref:ras-related protein Rap-1-like n=1 Tax=Haliotis asinina TaxID=109174 RepID=UPI0035326FBB